MAEFDIDSTLETLNSQLSELSDVNETINQLETNINNLNAQIDAQESNLEPGAKEKTQNQLDNNRARQTELAAKYLGSLEDFNNKVAEQIGNNVTAADMDLSGPVKDWNVHVKQWFFDLGDDVGEQIRQLQKSVGEDGKSLNESPETISRIRRFFEKSKGFATKYGLQVFISLYAILSAISIGTNWKKDFEQQNNGLNFYQSIGCYQYNTKNGTIRAIGICGATKICASRTNKTSCEAPNPVGKYCQWTETSGGNYSCVPGQHFTNGTQCGLTCSSDKDCITVNSVNCDPKTNPCLSGYCQDGKCQGGQKCDQATKQCSPSVSFDPNFPIKKQMEQGRLGFCLQGMPPTPCPGASSVCSVIGENGCCDKCDDNDPSCDDMGGRVVNSSCMCTGNNWVTIPMCGGISSILSMLSYMKVNSSQWVPQKTPLIIYVITGIGLVMFLITLVWYVFYLIKHGKK